LTENAGTDPLSERQRREAALDETIEQSFPASDPPSSDPNPDSHSAITPNVLDDDTEETEGRVGWNLRTLLRAGLEMEAKRPHGASAKGRDCGRFRR